jgi:CHAT domain-containing protein/tetratricopeptide (TPR) repeat protein
MPATIFLTLALAFALALNPAQALIFRATPCVAAVSRSATTGELSSRETDSGSLQRADYTSAAKQQQATNSTSAANRGKAGQPSPLRREQSPPPTGDVILLSATDTAVEIPPRETRSCRFEVGTGQYARVAIDPRGFPLKVSVVGGDGKRVFETVLPEDDFDVERISVVAETQSFYRVELTSLTRTSRTIRIALRLEDLRAQVAEDNKRIEAEQLSAAARVSLSGRTKQSLTTALERYAAAREIWRALGQRREEAETLLAIGRISHNLSLAANALTYYRQSLELWRSLGDRGKEAQTLSAMGWTYSGMGRLQDALEYYSQALPIRREIKDQRGLAQTLTTLGQTYAAMGEPQKAITYYSESLPMARQAGDKIQEAFALNSFSLLYAQLGEYQKALDCTDRALPIWQATGQKYGEADALNNKGIIYDKLGDFEKSTAYYQRSLEISQILGNRIGESDALHNIGIAYCAWGSIRRSPDLVRKSVDYLNRALAIRQAIGPNRRIAAVLGSLGLVYDSLDERDKALDYYKQALEKDDGAVRVRNNIGLNYYFRGDYNRAIEYSTDALERDREAGDSIGEANALRVIALSRMHLGNLEEALANNEAALAIVESVRSKTAGPEARRSYETFSGRFYSIKVKILFLMHQKDPSAGYDARALEATEAGRARGLLDLLEETRVDIREGVEPDLLDRERSLERNLNAKEQYRMRLIAAKAGEAQRAAVDKELASLIDEYQEVRDQIRAKSPRYASLTQPTPLSVKDIQALLDNDTLILAYWLTSEEKFMWLISSHSVSMYEIPGGPRFFELCDRVYKLLTARNAHPPDETLNQRTKRLEKADEDYKKAAAELSESILGPVASKLGHRRLVIVSDSSLQYIPLGALPIPQPVSSAETASSAGSNASRDSAPLIASHEIVVLPSVSALSSLRRELSRRETLPGQVAILADPVFSREDPRFPTDEGFNSRGRTAAKDPPRSPESAGIEGMEPVPLKFRRLRFSREEADQIARYADPRKTVEAVDFAANKEALVEGRFNKYGILHFATHTVLNSERPELSGVVFSLLDKNGNARDGFLRLHEIYNLKLSANLLVLSACETALGAEVRGEGLVGLTRGFMYAGVPRIVASLWSVDDRATAELMKRFYKAMLVDHLRPAAALRTAQIEMLTEEGWRPPYYWAAFTLEGDWR